MMRELTVAQIRFQRADRLRAQAVALRQQCGEMRRAMRTATGIQAIELQAQLPLVEDRLKRLQRERAEMAT